MPFGIYVHLPFCRVHCSYCAFAVSTDLGLQDRYADALVAEIERSDGGLQVDTIFFGGGTPSRTSLTNLERVSAQLRQHFDIQRGAEWTIEANPEDVTPDSIARWGGLGCNRLSIGVQSFNDKELIPIGRIHGEARARQAVSDAVNSGLAASLDLILGLPSQTAASFRETLGVAIDSGVGHLSLYMLDLEEGSALARQVDAGRVEIPDDALVADLYVEAIERLESAGIQQYEISNFARPGQQSRHNLRYWQRAEYLGFGAGAHSFVGNRRFSNTRDVAAYTGGAQARDLDEVLGSGEERRELLFLQLRQVSGIHYEDVVNLCGEEGTRWIGRGMNEGWLQRVGERVAFTPAGFLLSNDYLSQLF